VRHRGLQYRGFNLSVVQVVSSDREILVEEPCVAQPYENSVIGFQPKVLVCLRGQSRIDNRFIVDAGEFDIPLGTGEAKMVDSGGDVSCFRWKA
jgi:hypothetical protein